MRRGGEGDIVNNCEHYAKFDALVAHLSKEEFQLAREMGMRLKKFLIEEDALLSVGRQELTVVRARASSLALILQAVQINNEQKFGEAALKNQGTR